MGVFSRPRTGPELCALAFALLALTTGISAAITSLVRLQVQSTAVVWCCVLCAVSGAARLWPFWSSEIRAMTRDRFQTYLGSALLLYVALSFSVHLLAASLDLGDGYLLPGPASSPRVAPLLLLILGGLGVAVLAGVPLERWAAALMHATSRTITRVRARRVVGRTEIADLPAADLAPLALVTNEPASEPSPLPGGASGRKSRQVRESKVSTTMDDPPSPNGTVLPPVDTFNPPVKGPAEVLDVDLNARRIEETLASFNVQAKVVGYHSGPAVTQFDVQPERGVKVRRITELQNDLALALAAPTIRIQAPVPGKPVVGIEIPNSSTATVALRELLESDLYRSHSSPLKVALGKDVLGNTSIIDLAKMPHLLIAGATGSGKSVCVNGIISCLLYQNQPEQVRLMMIDPKMVELTVYNGVPHLLSPVVTDMDKVVGVLQWAIREMERRYKLFADIAVRNIQRYNEKMDAAGLKRLPYIVLVVDELADLMMVAPEDVEDAICRLAQLARACGIHLVIATQRPSVDVVTGLIKANFPARIAFAMTSQVDSRTILDTVGAEKLLGRGDMLYMPPDAPRAVRLQGAYLSDTEIERLVEFWKVSPLQDSAPRVPDEEFVAAQKEAEAVGDELLGEATRVVREYHHASVTLLQRRLKVGYARAARLMDQLEERGIVGPADGSKQRPVLAWDGEDDASISRPH